MKGGKCYFSAHSPPPLQPPQLLSRSTAVLPPLSVPYSRNVPMLHDNVSRSVSCASSVFVECHSPQSDILEEQQAAFKGYIPRKDGKFLQQQVLKKRVTADESEEFDRYIKYLERNILLQPFNWKVPNLSMQWDVNTLDCSSSEVLNLSEKETSATKEKLRDNIAADATLIHRVPVEEQDRETETSIKPIVKSTRLRRRSMNRKPSVPLNVHEISLKKKRVPRKYSTSIDDNDFLKLFLPAPSEMRPLTAKEEKDLFLKIQDLKRLEEVKLRLQAEYGREPTTTEWAKSAGMSCQALRSCLHSGNRSRERVLHANFLLIVHVAKQYEGMGLGLRDMLQEGGKGLMHSLERFKQTGRCRFSTYAFWWIRQTIRKAIFQKSRLIRLPESFFAFMKTVYKARGRCMQKSCKCTDNDIAEDIGMSSEKFQSLLMISRNPSSLQQRPFLNGESTFQEIVADTELESPERGVAKSMMWQHLDHLLGKLDARQRGIIQHRFGIGNRVQLSLAEVGDIFGVSKERVRQLEVFALNSLRRSLHPQELRSYAELLQP